MSSTQKPIVLVVGGGFSGAYFAKAATKSGYQVILVDKKNFFDVKFASLRAAVKPEGAKQHIFMYTSIPGIGTFKQGSVTSIDSTSAQLDNGEIIKFDYAVICTGSTNKAGAYAQPQNATDIEGRFAELKQTADSIQKAKRILIIGAGSVGFELAGEISDAYAGKEITLVHSGSKLFDKAPAKIGEYCEKWMKDRNIQIIYKEKATPQGDKKVLLSSGNQIEADLVIWTVGTTPNTQFLQKTALAPALDDSGRVKVEPTLQVVGFPNIFALGDINDVKEEKMGYYAKLQAGLTGKNFATMMRSGKGAKLAPWTPSNGMSALVLPMGKSAGTGFFGSCILPSFMVAWLKSSDLFVSQTRRELGV